MRRHKASSERHTESHGIELAPMLDFVINLLIFFIVTAVFVKETGLTVNRPSSVADASEQTDALEIAIFENGDVYVNDRQTDVRAVRANVERYAALAPEAGALIVAQQGTSTGLFVDVVDQVHQAGIYDITFSTNN